MQSTESNYLIKLKIAIDEAKQMYTGNMAEATNFEYLMGWNEAIGDLSYASECGELASRQWRNPVTLETRNLSGAAYWDTRKANKPQEVPLSAHFRENGAANIDAYADKPPTPRPKRIAKPVPIRHKISPAQRTLDRLDEQEAQLHKEYKTGGLTEEEFFDLQAIIDLKRQKAFKTLQKLQDDIDKAFPKYSGGKYEYPTHPEQKP